MKELISLMELILISQINQKGCHHLSMVAYDLNNFMILNIKSVDYRCYVFNMSKNDAVTLLNNSVLDNKGVL